jgi:ElaB/YqjD/DUF883 family membrane-anchored ribosome-binding protein
MSEPGAASTGAAKLLDSLEDAGIPVSSVKAMVDDLVRQRPEVAVAGAFAAGLLLAMIVRRLGR